MLGIIQAPSNRAINARSTLLCYSAARHKSELARLKAFLAQVRGGGTDHLQPPTPPSASMPAVYSLQSAVAHTYRRMQVVWSVSACCCALSNAGVVCNRQEAHRPIHAHLMLCPPLQAAPTQRPGLRCPAAYRHAGRARCRNRQDFSGLGDRIGAMLET